jgi:hypothetical protein
MSTTLQVQLILSDDELTVLRRYLAEVNAMLHESKAVMDKLQIEHHGKEEWTEADAAAMLFRASLDFERRVQMVRDGQTTPPWLEQIVAESIQDLRREAGQ